MKIIKILICVAVGALAFVACKPTEKNYREAYDAAVAKRQKAAEEQMRPATGLMSDEGPQMRVLNGDTLFVTHEMLRHLDGTRIQGRWALAVGMYKMDTNAKASADDLAQANFPEATAVRSTGDRYYTVAAFAQTLDSIQKLSLKFKAAYPNYPYVGLPGAPVMIAF